ncbi:helix-turn-helix transcriptional regulator [Facilibium subflavum]|uniref:helix-turn-helix transcriptional regulator n=1 Tax=Facilibium subflavum TaxID=2219058 RepID=UPI000E64DEC0|nr:helix-turn-helix transcriptional regulator [Facilibium subflavum]
MAVFELTQKLAEVKNFSLYLKNAIQMSANTSNILKILPHNICNFTFFRLNENAEFNMVTSKPLRGYKYVSKGFWRSDVTMNVNYAPPIYDRREFLAQSLLPQYDHFINEIGGKSCVIISYRLSDFKDAFIFVFPEMITPSDYARFYPVLHNVAIAFYHLEVKFNTTFRLPAVFSEEYQHQGLSCEFDSFAPLVHTHDLTKTQAKYLLFLALHMPLDYIAALLFKSRRTVEKTVDEIRAKLDVNSKFELCQLLSAYHISQVQQVWLPGFNIC